MTRLEQKRQFRHKIKMHLTVWSILTLATLSAIVCGKIHSYELDLKLNTQQVYATTPIKPYVEPRLDPNTDERQQVITLIERIWGKSAPIGLDIARCESGYNPKAVNHNTNNTYDLGVFQINSVHNMPEMENPVANISYAYSMYIQQGTNPWYSSEKCWSK